MIQPTINITGIRELDAKLARFTVSAQRKIIRKAVREAAKPVLMTARAKVPVDTGELRRSLAIRALKRSRKNKDRLGVRVVTGDEFFRGDQFYGAFLEFGAPGHRHFGGPVVPLEPRPYMRPAHDLNKDEVASIFRDEIAAIIRETAAER